MGFECAVVHNLFKCPGEVQRIGIKISLLRFLEEFLNPYVHNVEKTHREKLAVALEIAICCLVPFYVE